MEFTQLTVDGLTVLLVPEAEGAANVPTEWLYSHRVVVGKDDRMLKNNLGAAFSLRRWEQEAVA